MYDLNEIFTNIIKVNYDLNVSLEAHILFLSVKPFC